jgi:hypothetical protein
MSFILFAACLLAGTPATQPPPESVEELSSCLLGFCSPHVLPYATAALQVLQGRSTADITRALVPNGVLPLVGRPENLQVSVYVVSVPAQRAGLQMHQAVGAVWHHNRQQPEITLNRRDMLGRWCVLMFICGKYATWLAASA